MQRYLNLVQDQDEIGVNLYCYKWFLILYLVYYYLIQILAQTVVHVHTGITANRLSLPPLSPPQTPLAPLPPLSPLPPLPALLDFVCMVSIMIQ